MPSDREILEAVMAQDYPLSIDWEAAEACYRSIRAVMEMVPEDDKVLVRGHYDDVTAALCHPPGGVGNIRVP